MLNRKGLNEALNIEIDMKKFSLVIIGIIITLIPIIIRAISVNNESSIAGWSSGLSNNVDVYFLIKIYLFYLLIGILSITFIMALWRKLVDVPNDIIIGLSLIFILFIIISGYTSEYPAVAFFGAQERYEGVFIFCCYVIFMIILCSILSKTTQIVLLNNCLLLSGIIVAVLGISEFMGINLLETPVIQRLWVPKELLGTIGFKTVKYKAYSTMYNPNYLSGYLAIIIFIPFISYIFTTSRKKRYAMFCSTLLIWGGLVSSSSSSGFVSFIFCTSILFVYILKKHRERLIKLYIVLLACAVIFLSMNMYSKGNLSSEVGNTAQYIGKVLQLISSPFTNKNETKKVGISEQVDPNLQEALSYVPKQNSFYRIGSGRGYIWITTLKVIKERPLIGYGMDTLAYYYPQGDLRKIYDLNISNVEKLDVKRLFAILDKPHSIYLQIAVGAGSIALFIFLLMNVALAVKTVKMILKDSVAIDKDNYVLIAAFLGWLSYLIQGIFNDSTIVVSVIYWYLFGVLIAYKKFSSENLDKADNINVL